MGLLFDARFRGINFFSYAIFLSMVNEKVKTGPGIHTIYIDILLRRREHDSRYLRFDQGLTACLDQTQQGAPATSPSCTKLGPAEDGQARSSPVYASEPRSKICRAENLKRNWNGSAMDVRFAPSWIDHDGKGDSLAWNGFGLWTSLSYGFDKFES